MGNSIGTEYGIEVGGGYRRVLGAGREATIGAKFGLLQSKSSFLNSVRVDKRRLVSGNLNFQYQLARKWQTSATYGRGLQFLPGLTEPVILDSMTLGVAGSLTTRTVLNASVAYLQGGSYTQNQAVDSYLSQVRVAYPVLRNLQVYGEYLHYSYDFSQRSLAVPGVPTSLRRNGLRGGVTLNVPVARR